MKLPKRWLKYEKSARIHNTPFVASKTPLSQNYSMSLDYETSFTPKNLLLAHPRIKMVIDLTNTYKYYNGIKEFQEEDINYVKIACIGHGLVPSEEQFEQFARTVNAFLQSHKGYLIAVHCTHGVNRTGYFIVRFMIEHMGWDAEVALRRFCASRGHAIERTALVKDLFERKCENRQETKAQSF